MECRRIGLTSTAETPDDLGTGIRGETPILPHSLESVSLLTTVSIQTCFEKKFNYWCAGQAQARRVCLYNGSLPYNTESGYES